MIVKPNGTYLNIGCGRNLLPQPWVNCDLMPSAPSVRRIDINMPLPCEDASVDGILIEHCLEHTSGPEAFRFMQEAHRVLVSGGVLRVCVPHLRRLDRKKAADIITNHGHLMVYASDSLRRMLWAAGFEPLSINETDRDEIDGHYKVIGLELDDLETLRMEAVK